MKKVMLFGTGAKAACHKEYMGKEVYLVITKRMGINHFCIRAAFSVKLLYGAYVNV